MSHYLVNNQESKYPNNPLLCCRQICNDLLTKNHNKNLRVTNLCIDMTGMVIKNVSLFRRAAGHRKEYRLKIRTVLEIRPLATNVKNIQMRRRCRSNHFSNAKKNCIVKCNIL